MIVLEFKAYGKSQQYSAIDEAMRTVQFIRNKALRFWMENSKVSKYDLNKYCALLAREFPFADELNSMARQSAAERAWSAISRFFENGTSQECSQCGVVVKKSLSTRTHACACGCVLDRDHNAARNILSRGLSTVGHTGTFAKDASNASGGMTATGAGAILPEQVASLREESHSRSSVGVSTAD